MSAKFPRGGEQDLFFSSKSSMCRISTFALSILAQQIRISEILAWVRNSYLTHVVTRGLFIFCICIHAHGRQVTPMFSANDVKIM